MDDRDDLLRRMQETQERARIEQMIDEKLGRRGMTDALQERARMANNQIAREAADNPPNQAKPGARGLACNVWLDHMVDENGCELGKTRRNNALYDTWVFLWEFESGVTIDDPEHGLLTPWRSYKRGYADRHKGKKKGRD